MIEKMKMVYIVSSVSEKEKMLEGLRSIGLLHISERKSARHDVSEKVITLMRTYSSLADYAPDKKAKKSKPYSEPPVLSDAAFSALYKMSGQHLTGNTS